MGRLSPENRLAVSEMMHHITPALSYVHSRWNDKKALEGLDEYSRILEKELPEGFSMIRMTKIPFGFRFKFHEVPDTIFIATINPERITWKSVSFRSPNP